MFWLAELYLACLAVWEELGLQESWEQVSLCACMWVTAELIVRFIYPLNFGLL